VTPEQKPEIRIQLFPEPLEIGETEGFSEKDLLGRRELGDRLTSLVSSVVDPQVIALNGQWGSGKTTFLKMWAGELRQKGFPVVYFDAFENDYVEDAFGALARELVMLAESAPGNKKATVKSLKEKAVGLGSHLLRSGTKLGAKVGAKVLTAGIVSDDDLKEILQQAIEGSADAAEQYMEQLLDHPKKQKSLADSFRASLSSLPAALALPQEGEEQRPLIYIIDELDRCRPDFALSILERIKHFLSVKNVYFVLGVHQEQLENSVRYAYGPDIDASNYLNKFITLSISFDLVRRPRKDYLALYADFLQRTIRVAEEDRRALELTNEFVLRICRQNGYTLRPLERIFGNISLAFALGGQRTLKLGPIIGGLCVLKVVQSRLFTKAKKGTLVLEDIAPLFGFTPRPSPDDHDASWEYEWWDFCIGKNQDQYQDRANKISFDYNLGSADVVPYIANNVVERFANV